VLDAILIEGLSGALRTAAFLLPAGLGVQEGALLVLCGWIGVPPAQALALALVKRARELAVGGAGLLVWLALERPALRRQLTASRTASTLHNRCWSPTSPHPSTCYRQGHRAAGARAPAAAIPRLHRWPCRRRTAGIAPHAPALADVRLSH